LTETGAADAPDPSRPMTGIVFCRLRSPAEREAARRLLADRGAPPLRVRMPGETVLDGLWDLAAPNGEGWLRWRPHNALMTPGRWRCAASSSAPTCGVGAGPAACHRGGRRLAGPGAARLVVRLDGDHRPAAALLTRAGFAATTDADGQSAGTEVGWLYREL
jgi:hypothetical protein